jgi:hypothetical protein
VSRHDESRREFLKLAGYVAPVMLTLSVLPREAGAGSNNYNSSENKNNSSEEKSKKPKKL